ncbi:MULTISPECIES: hypothetical protein [Staphylococcus]|uniref:DUF1381 domain-containing protein n=1 Tax=Staphylococcus TaxID=1279 RepID=UPI00122E9CE6|nr:MULTISPECIES: hypothetical protein [Staphylococcus]KAA2278084.1 hypothetical protein F1592_00750 [Staphylococcus sp. GDX7P312P]KAA2281479.1 hypothetical protein F1591_03255 [Staphylococcus sp. GDX7P459A]MCH4482904.1 hypothetical protein [Staphylococcus haemolyticus]
MNDIYLIKETKHEKTGEVFREIIKAKHNVSYKVIESNDIEQLKQQYPSYENKNMTKRGK